MMHFIILFIISFIIITVLFGLKQFFFRKKNHSSRILSKEYLVGLNYLLNEEQDKALDVFIKMLEVDSDTVETHLALGNLFRKRGEVERAIRIHQNLIVRPNLHKDIRFQALLALALDYMNAGVLDRAEKLFLELVDSGYEVRACLLNLLDIYEQEKDWDKAIHFAKKASKHCAVLMDERMSHYYCELAEIHIKKDEADEAVRDLKQALKIHASCVRATLLLADIDNNAGRYKRAISHLKKVPIEDVDFFTEAIAPLEKAYEGLQEDKALISYLKGLLKEFPKAPIAVMLSERIRKTQGEGEAEAFLVEYVKKYPSLYSVHYLVSLHLALVEGKMREDSMLLHRMTKKILAKRPSYQCIKCGFSGNALHWQCPSCRKWGQVKPVYMIEH